MGNLLGLSGQIKTIVDKSFSLAVIISVLLIIFYLGRMMMIRLIKRYSNDKDNPQVATLLTVLKSAWKYFMLMIGLISVLNIFGMSITANSLLAAAGAGGLVLGIGAQDFIKDIVNGFSIIMENQYSVGDCICVNNLRGTVTNMTLRTTRIMGDSDETLIIPNSAVSTVVNYSRQPQMIKCHVYISKEEQLQDALMALKLMAMEFKSPYSISGAKLVGVTAIYPYGIEVRISSLCNVNNMVQLKCIINSSIADTLTEANISFINDKLSMTGGENVGV